MPAPVSGRFAVSPVATNRRLQGAWRPEEEPPWALLSDVGKARAADYSTALWTLLCRFMGAIWSRLVRLSVGCMRRMIVGLLNHRSTL